MTDATDRLAALLDRFSLTARMLPGGCPPAAGPCVAMLAIADDGARPPAGGTARGPREGADGHAGHGGGGEAREGGATCAGDPSGGMPVWQAPVAVFLPQAERLGVRFAAEEPWVLLALEFGHPGENPLLAALPSQLVFSLAGMPAQARIAQALCDEASARRCGHVAVVERLAEALLVQLLRGAIEHRRIDAGLMAGLADPRLARALAALHADPARAWTLAALAEEAGMSRARFAAHFRRVLGLPPATYMARWRVGLAQSLLRRGRPLKWVAHEVGYGSVGALGRVFGQVTGTTPGAWASALRPA